jgi:hypothetical protein
MSDAATKISLVSLLIPRASLESTGLSTHLTGHFRQVAQPEAHATW